jgi:hypothetical protein
MFAIKYVVNKNVLHEIIKYVVDNNVFYKIIKYADAYYSSNILFIIFTIMISKVKSTIIELETLAIPPYCLA